MALWYTLVIGSLGALHPFLARTLSERGATSPAVAGVLLLFPMGFLTAGLLWGFVSDRSEHPVRWLRGAAAVAALSAVSACLSRSWFVTVVSLAGLALCRAPLVPLVDALTVAVLPDGSQGYGRVRAWGSLFFAVMVFGVGAFIDAVPDAPLWVNAALLCAAAAWTWRLPRAQFQARLGGLRELREVLRHRKVLAIIVIGGLLGVVHAVYDFLFSLYINALGAPTYWATVAFVGGLTVEVTVMFCAPSLLRLWGPVGMMRLAVWMSLPRFLLTGLDLPPAWIAAVQWSHGVTFGAFWMGAVTWLSDNVPEQARNSAQATLMAAAAGLGPMIMLTVATQAEDLGALKQLFFIASCVSILAIGVATWGLKEDPAEGSLKP